jgi:hypothetical protein
VTASAETELSGGAPFISDDDLEQAMSDAGVEDPIVSAVLDENRDARIDGLQQALSVLVVIALLALFATGLIPKTPVGSDPPDAEVRPPGGPPQQEASADRAAGGRRTSPSPSSTRSTT